MWLWLHFMSMTFIHSDIDLVSVLIPLITSILHSLDISFTPATIPAIDLVVNVQTDDFHSSADSPLYIQVGLDLSFILSILGGVLILCHSHISVGLLAITVFSSLYFTFRKFDIPPDVLILTYDTFIVPFSLFDLSGYSTIWWPLLTWRLTIPSICHYHSSFHCHLTLIPLVHWNFSFHSDSLYNCDDYIASRYILTYILPFIHTV